MNFRWIQSGIESAGRRPPYGLIVCGDSIHWFDWAVAMTRFSDSLAPDGCMAIVQRDWSAGEDLQARLRAIYANHGANPDFQPLDPVAELERRGLFERAGEHVTAPSTWSPNARHADRLPPFAERLRVGEDARSCGIRRRISRRHGGDRHRRRAVGPRGGCSNRVGQADSSTRRSLNQRPLMARRRRRVGNRRPFIPWASRMQGG